MGDCENQSVASGIRKPYTFHKVNPRVKRMSVILERDIKIMTDFAFRHRQQFNKERKSNKSTFAASVRSIHLVSRFFGFTPFSIDTKNGRISEARVSAIDILWLIICLTVYVYLIYICPTDLAVSFGASPALVYEHYMQLILGLLKAMFIIILDLINRHRIVSILIDLNRFDMQVRCAPIIEVQ